MGLQRSGGGNMKVGTVAYCDMEYGDLGLDIEGMNGESHGVEEEEEDEKLPLVEVGHNGLVGKWDEGG